MRKQLLHILIGISSGLLTFFYLNFGGDFLNGRPELRDLLFVSLLGVIIMQTIYGIRSLLDSYISWQERPGLRLLSGIFLNFISSISLIKIGMGLYASFRPELLPFQETSHPVFIKLIILSFSWVLMGSILYFAFHSYYLYSQGQLNEVKRSRKQIDLQLRALKDQLSPHYLFNNLNTISSLIYKDKNLAEAYIRKLAGSYQYTLETYDKTLVSLQEEMKFVKAYDYMLKTRFQDQIEIAYSIPQAQMESKVPPLSIQMLVENAAKHNQLSKEAPLKIEIGADSKYLWVKNNKTKSPSGIQSFKIGLSNINSRFKLLSAKEIIVENKDDFLVKLPIIA
ncbi:MAG: histidine kinase [Bacteroidia bacterium]|nr:histidine kinase [Bacteroidia bacterium]